ncbi:carbohydrate kinase family protein [Agromyces agglutinans]|nr:PfkB family carbohydrate kinase [Agromyces agglutinans]
MLAAGQLFLDVVFSELAEAPRPGEECWTTSFGWGPGGVANYAITAARLGVPTVLCADVGSDPISALLCARLADEGIIDGTRARTDWSVPVTAAMNFDGDRALVTGGVPAAPLAALLDSAPVTEVATLHLDGSVAAWVRSRAARGTRVIADVGWDPSVSWDPALLRMLDGCYAFVPNEAEALAYTRADDALEAAHRLSERVPLSVVTRGVRGVVAVDSSTGDEVTTTAVDVPFVDATGAGDVFGAALAAATLVDWTLRERVDFASLVAAITVSRPGGAGSTPLGRELLPWLDAHVGAAEEGRFDYLRDAFSDGAPPFDTRTTS